MAQPAGIALPAEPEIAHFARELKVLFWAPERLLKNCKILPLILQLKACSTTENSVQSYLC